MGVFLAVLGNNVQIGRNWLVGWWVGGTSNAGAALTRM